ncbi:MAG TPA: type II toxin-antitoxin system RelE/ParE family toxin [Verrucomicrobiae bacterium]|jgi:plasmid stabilization system protein ParE
MATVRLSAEARDELRQIFRTIASDDRNAARRVVGRILQRCPLLESHPLLGRERPEFALPGLRSVALSPHVLFYRVTGEKVVEIAHIIDGRRDLDALLDAGADETD